MTLLVADQVPWNGMESEDYPSPRKKEAQQYRCRV